MGLKSFLMTISFRFSPVGIKTKLYFEVEKLEVICRISSIKPMYEAVISYSTLGSSSISNRPFSSVILNFNSAVLLFLGIAIRFADSSGTFKLSETTPEIFLT